MRAVSLFSGVGGLDLAVEAHGIEVVAQVENDPYCTAVLERHWPEVPRYGDIKEINWHDFLERHGRPDLVVAGFPCQPTSQAGRRRAQEDPRWLWPEVARCLRVLRPPDVFLENTLGLLSRGFGDVLGDLAALGFDAEWDCLQAADVGAPHPRDRVFVLAYRPRAGGGRSRLGAVDAGQTGRGDVADAEGQQRRQGGTAEAERLGRPASGGPDVADAAGSGRYGGPPVARGGSPGGALLTGSGEAMGNPDLQRRDERAGSRRQLNGSGEPPDPGRGLAEPGVGGGAPRIPGGLDDHCWPARPGPEQYPWEPPRTVGRGVPNRGRRVKALGNAVVPQQGALAFGLLWQRVQEVAA